MLASVAVRSTFHRFTCFITPTMKPGALEANKYMPPNNFSINDPAMNMLKTWDSLVATRLDALPQPLSDRCFVGNMGSCQSPKYEATVGAWNKGL